MDYLEEAIHGGNACYHVGAWQVEERGKAARRRAAAHRAGKQAQARLERRHGSRGAR